jgi:hypothetical protein
VLDRLFGFRQSSGFVRGMLFDTILVVAIAPFFIASIVATDLFGLFIDRTTLALVSAALIGRQIEFAIVARFTRGPGGTGFVSIAIGRDDAGIPVTFAFAIRTCERKDRAEGRNSSDPRVHDSV